MAVTEITGYQSQNRERLASGGWFTYPWAITFTQTYIYVVFKLKFDTLENFRLMEGVTDPNNGIIIEMVNGVMQCTFNNGSQTRIGLTTGVDYSIGFRYAHGTKILDFGVHGNYSTSVQLVGTNFANSNGSYKFAIEGGTLFNVGSAESNLPVPAVDSYDFQAALDGNFDTIQGTITTDSGGPFVESYVLITD